MQKYASFLTILKNNAHIHIGKNLSVLINAIILLPTHTFHKIIFRGRKGL